MTYTGNVLRLYVNGLKDGEAIIEESSWCGAGGQSVTLMTSDGTTARSHQAKSGRSHPRVSPASVRTLCTWAAPRAHSQRQSGVARGTPTFAPSKSYSQAVSTLRGSWAG